MQPVSEQGRPAGDLCLQILLSQGKPVGNDPAQLRKRMFVAIGEDIQRWRHQRLIVRNWHQSSLPPDGSICAVKDPRSRTISLGIGAFRGPYCPELRSWLSANDREIPVFTRVNGTLMARRPWPGPMVLSTFRFRRGISRVDANRTRHRASVMHGRRSLMLAGCCCCCCCCHRCCQPLADRTHRARPLRSRTTAGTHDSPQHAGDGPASGSGRPLPDPWFLAGGGAEAPTLKGGPEDAFGGAVLKGSSGALDGGGAPPDTERASPDLSPARGTRLLSVVLLLLPFWLGDARVPSTGGLSDLQRPLLQWQRLVGLPELAVCEGQVVRAMLETCGSAGKGGRKGCTFPVIES
jgi:hypothetical protein